MDNLCQCPKGTTVYGGVLSGWEFTRNDNQIVMKRSFVRVLNDVVFQCKPGSKWLLTIFDLQGEYIFDNVRYNESQEIKDTLTTNPIHNDNNNTAINN